MTTITDLERHFVALFANEEAAIQWCSRPSKALTVSDGEFELICAPRIKSAISYAVAMHELGHIKGPTSAVVTKSCANVGLGNGRGAMRWCGRHA